MKKESLIRRMLFVCALFSSFIVFLIIIFLLQEGAPALTWDFLTGMTWSPHNDQFGIIPTLVGTLYVVFGAVAIAIAIGIPCAIFLAEFAPFWLRNVVKSSVEVLVGVPSIVLGFFGLLIMVPFIRNNIGGMGESILAAWIILAIMILPNIITISEDALRSVPQDYRTASLALGATKWQTVRKVLLPNAMSGIRAGIVLGLGRALGETMAVLMVVGNPEIPWIPTAILDRARMLTSTIAIEWAYMVWGSPHQHAIFALGIVLFVLVSILNLVASFVIKERTTKR
jgi:phosphate transport system permease protein